MIRLFVGLDLPQPVVESLGRLQTGSQVRAGKPANQLHLTLRFIGEVDT